MQIILNGQAQPLDTGLSLQDFILSLGLENKRYAVELNHSIVPRSRYLETPLADGDQIEIIHAVGGG